MFRFLELFSVESFDDTWLLRYSFKKDALFLRQRRGYNSIVFSWAFIAEKAQNWLSHLISDRNFPDADSGDRSRIEMSSIFLRQTFGQSAKCETITVTEHEILGPSKWEFKLMQSRNPGLRWRLHQSREMGGEIGWQANEISRNERRYQIGLWDCLSSLNPQRGLCRSSDLEAVSKVMRMLQDRKTYPKQWI
jgi:hypothetical protein